MPVTAAGVPVLAAGGVALLVGVLSRRHDPTEIPGPDDVAGGAPLMWTAILLAGVGCYLLKLAGLSLPERVLSHPTVERVADLIPVALLAALVAVQVVRRRPRAHARRPRAGPRLRRRALLLRAPFLVVVVGAAVVAALALVWRSDARRAASARRPRSKCPRVDVPPPSCDRLERHRHQVEDGQPRLEPT